MKVSVLIPVFNAEATLPASLDSIASQTYTDIELCVVDDCSTDGSSGILSAFKSVFESSPGRTVTMVRHRGNYGAAAARNTLLDACTGDFVCFVDADDILAPETLEKAVSVMVGNNSDIVGWDWTLASDSGTRYMRQSDCPTPEDALKAMMGGSLRWNLWLFLSRRGLYDGVRFLPGANMGEDMTATLRTMMKAESFTQIHEALYTYRQTGSSISRSMTDRNLSDIKENLALVESALAVSAYSGLANDYIPLLKLNLKLPLLVSRDKNDYIRWSGCFPEADAFVMRNTHLPMRTKLLQWMASKRLWIGVKLYNDLIYGILYRLYLCGRF